MDFIFDQNEPLESQVKIFLVNRDSIKTSLERTQSFLKNDSLRVGDESLELLGS